MIHVYNIVNIEEIEYTILFKWFGLILVQEIRQQKNAKDESDNYVVVAETVDLNKIFKNEDVESLDELYKKYGTYLFK